VDGELQPKVAAAATRFESNFSAIPAPSPGTAPTLTPDRLSTEAQLTPSAFKPPTVVAGPGRLGQDADGALPP